MNTNDVEVLDIHEFDKNKSNNSGKIKMVLLLLILIIILLIGVGLYSFLKYAKETSQKIKLEDQIVELGSEFSEDIIKIKNKQDCEIDLSQVDTNKVGTYKYSVKCNKRKSFANIEVKDTIAPTVELKIVNTNGNNQIVPKQFILSAYDLSEISYEFVNEFDINSCNENGIYLIPIKVTDEYDNAKISTGILLISNIAASKFLSASKIITTKYNATLELTDKIGFNQVNYYVNAIRIYNYSFNSKEEYENVKKEYNENQVIDNVKGQAIFDDDNLKIQLVVLLTREELNKMNGNFPFTYSEIQNLYSSLDYKNKMEE